MSSQSWQQQLRRTLRRLQMPDRPLSVAVVGVGHELRGDDAVGVVIARELAPLFRPPEPDGGPHPAGAPSRKQAHALAIDAGPAPENVTGPIRRFEPDLVLLIDAALLGEPAGTVAWLDRRSVAQLSTSTHTLPLALFAEYLATELVCDVAILGIQPAGATLGAPLSPRVRRAAQAVIRELAAALS